MRVDRSPALLPPPFRVGSGRGSALVAVLVALLASCGADPVGPSAPANQAPSYSPAADILVYADSMEAYADPTSMLARANADTAGWAPGFGVDAGLQLVRPGYGGTGQALREAYSGAYQGSEDWDLRNVPATPDTATQFFQYEGRVTLQAPLGSSVLAVKWFMAFHADGTRVQWNTHDHLPCTAQAPGESGYWQVYDQAETSCQGNQPVGPYPDQVFDGQWHRFTYEYRPNTSPGSRDGIARMWIDDTKVIDISASAVGVTPPGGYKPWCQWDDVDALSTHGVVLLRWASTQTTATPPYTIDMDDFLWWRAR